MSTENDPPRVELASAGVPADHGLSSLGLIMQLAGSVAAAAVALSMFVMLFGLSPGSSDILWTFLLLGLAITRSMFHRLAGIELLYGRRLGIEIDVSHPFAGVDRYILAALAQTAITALIAYGTFDMPGKVVFGFVIALLAWPITLAILRRSPRLKKLSPLPVSEDKGFEGAAILMTVLGLCGAIGTGLFLFVMLDQGGDALLQGPGVLMLIAILMLVIRSGVHVQAGLAGLRETSVDRAVELASRYANFGVISALCAGGAVLLISMTSRFEIAVLSLVIGMSWILMAWPLIIRRFFSERQFAVLADETANQHHRAPDAGLTGLGWLLIGYAMFLAAMMIPTLIGGPRAMPDKLGGLLAFGGPIGDRSLWWNAGFVALQLWAGLELVRMSPRHRVVAIGYGVIAAGAAIYMFWPALEMFGAFRVAVRDPELLLLIPTMTFQLVLPVATVLLVTRTIAPTARARFRVRPASP